MVVSARGCMRTRMYFLTTDFWKMLKSTHSGMGRALFRYKDMLSSSPTSSQFSPTAVEIEVLWHPCVRVPPNLVNVAVQRGSALALAGSCRSVRTSLRSTTICWDKCACFRLDGLGCKAVGWQCNEGETVMCCTSVRSRFRYKVLDESHKPCMDTWHSLVA
jgi:hypothetical protein